ncbi:CaiB/BaiF CoA transferase family protein [Echinimonas agarilytica]|uniref:CoA transferase n=1 Tax=Echinimonas agarilytica TaxID=1215918 RepID=A0AA41W657_9GAMM|nr:CaiB/BaiF CoA-transferase family protein [Echinimonas agarilytica]MCM2679710.1 CoA transferase [Echinimonas agarilytica]
MIKPLDGLLVVDFSQFLSGPSTTLRLADLGARVIKIEHHLHGDITRSMYASHLNIEGDSAFYQAVNRGKESVQANLKSADDLEVIKRIVEKADILVHNFRPGVMARLGLAYADVKSINPNIVYGSISGYGNQGPYAEKPGQDLLVQALSGNVWQTGKDSDGPTPMGYAIADVFAGAQLVQGILAALLADESAEVEVSMLEAMLDFQFEPLTLYYQDGGEPIVRGDVNAAHPLVGAPYGLYKTTTGYLALAMGAIPKLAELLSCDGLNEFADPNTWYKQRDAIKAVLAAHLSHESTEYWLAILEPADIWCAKVLNWTQLVEHDGFKVLDMVQSVTHGLGHSYQTTRCPIRFDESIITNAIGAPSLGQHTANVIQEFSKS